MGQKYQLNVAERENYARREFEKNLPCVGKKSKTDKKVILHGFLYCNVSFLWKKETQKLFKIDNPEYLVS